MTGETGCRIVIQARTQDGPCVQASYVKALNPYVENNENYEFWYQHHASYGILC